MMSKIMASQKKNHGPPKRCMCHLNPLLLLQLHSERDALNSDERIPDWEPNLFLQQCLTLELFFFLHLYMRLFYLSGLMGVERCLEARHHILFENQVATTGSGAIQASFLYVPVL